MDNMNSRTPGQPEGPSRREFLTRAGLMAGGLAFLGLSGIKPPSVAAATTDVRAFTGSSSALELDGQFMDYLKSEEGGFPKSDVINDTLTGAPITKKHIAQPKYQDIAIQCDPVMPKPLFDWIAATLTASFVRKNGAIITADFNHAEQSRLQFSNALLTEFTIPTLDAASKDPLYVTVKFSPETSAALGGKGTILPPVKSNKAALASNFRLKIPGLDCTKVIKIDALTVKQTVQQETVGLSRESVKQPGKLEVSNVSLYLPEGAAGTFYSWFQDMVVKGNASDAAEKAGTIEILDPTLTSSLFTVYLNHLGIFGFSPDRLTSGTDAVRRVKVEMYCEQITLAPVKA